MLYRRFFNMRWNFINGTGHISVSCSCGMVGMELFTLVYPLSTHSTAVIPVFLVAWIHDLRHVAVSWIGLNLLPSQSLTRLQLLSLMT